MRTLRQVFKDPGVLDEVSGLGSRLVFLAENDKQRMVQRIGEILTEARFSPDSAVAMRDLSVLRWEVEDILQKKK